MIPNEAIRVMVVDDEPDIRQTLERLIRSEGYMVSTAANGREALEALAAEPADLVVSDVRMPVMDGIELMKAVKARDEMVEFIILTGYASLENAVAAMRENGAFDYLAKPPDNPDALLNTIARALERRRLKLKNKALVAELKQKNEALETAVREIRTLKGILPICSGCKKIRDEKGDWHHVESYIEKRSHASFTHSMCGECLKSFYGGEEWFEEGKYGV